jgi:hypothetical protein
MSNEQKMISIAPIPLSKLTVVINNFIANTITHLNKLSVKGEEKLSEFDNKLNDLDAMTTLLEAKLNSLPGNITSNYPPLEPINLVDIIQIDIQQPPENPTEPPKPDDDSQDVSKKDEQPEKGPDTKEANKEDLSPEVDLENFLNQNEELKPLYKMIKVGVPLMGVRNKGQSNGIDMDLVEEMIEKAKKVNPSIS